MDKDPLDVLLRLRRLAVDQARQGLAECLAEETAAATRCAEIAAAIANETSAASDIGADDQAVEAFAAWLRRTLPTQTTAMSALTEAEARTKEARIVLGAARAGVRAVETILDRKIVERGVLQARAEQHALDEVAGRSSRCS